MRIVLRYKKIGMIRFLSPLETNKAIERHLRRASLPLVFSQGYHPTPKISYLDSIATGVVQRKLYITIEVKNWKEDYLKKLCKLHVKGLIPTKAWVVNLDINSIVTSYKFSILMEKEAIDNHKLNENLIIRKGKKKKEYRLNELLDSFELFDLKKFTLLKYTLHREKLFSPWEVVKAVKIKDGLFIPILESVYSGTEELDLILNREAEWYGEAGNACR